MGNSTSIKSLVLFHDACSDGFAAAFAAWLKFGDDAEYVPMQYGKLPDDESWEAMTTDSEVYILDFSLEKGMMNVAFARAKCVVWLDHHASVFKDWNIPLSVVGDNAYFSIEDTSHYVRLDNSKSGAMLAWEYFHPGTEVPMFIRHIDDYDRWQFKIDGTKELQKALWSAESWNFPQWKVLLESDLTPMYKAGKAILRAHDQNVQRVIKGTTRECSIVPAIINSVDSYKAPWVWWKDGEFGDTCGVKGLAANCPPHLVSDVGHELAKQSGTFGLCWHMMNDGRIKVDLRSNGDYDVSAIAKSLGGGGHLNAAGCVVDIKTLLRWLK